MTDLARIPSREEINVLGELGNQLAQSGFFKDAQQGQQAFAKILFGRDLGLPATTALTAIHVVEGQPVLSAGLQATMVRQTPGYDYRVREHTPEVCEIAFLRDGEEIGVERYTLDDAKQAGLTGRKNWQRYPRNMLFARAMSNGVAFHCPEVTAGMRTYTDGEIDHEPAPPAPAPVEPVVDAEPVAPEPLIEAVLEVAEQAGLRNDRLRMELVAVGVEDATDLPAAFQALTEAQAVALRERIEMLAKPEPEPEPEAVA